MSFDELVDPVDSPVDHMGSEGIADLMDEGWSYLCFFFFLSYPFPLFNLSLRVSAVACTTLEPSV
jgi:hypothetical protein